MNEISTTNNNSTEDNKIEIDINGNKPYQDKKDYLNEILYFSINQESK